MDNLETVTEEEADDFVRIVAEIIRDEGVFVGADMEMEGEDGTPFKMLLIQNGRTKFHLACVGFEKGGVLTEA